jgi:hypothetical protein
MKRAAACLVNATVRYLKRLKQLKQWMWLRWLTGNWVGWRGELAWTLASAPRLPSPRSASLTSGLLAECSTALPGLVPPSPKGPWLGPARTRGPETRVATTDPCLPLASRLPHVLGIPSTTCCRYVPSALRGHKYAVAVLLPQNLLRRRHAPPLN